MDAEIGLHDKHLRYLDWLTTPPPERVPSSKQKFADELVVNVKTLRTWEKRADFQAAWEQRVKQLTGTPERAQSMLDRLYETAMDPRHRDHVRAMDLYFKLTGRIKPPEPEKRALSAAELSDSELEALIAQGVQHELHRRGRGVEVDVLVPVERGTVAEQVQRVWDDISD